MTDNSIIYNNFLTNASVADAKHDFHNYTTILEYLVKNKSAFADGLPGNNSNYTILNEALTLASVVKLTSSSPPSPTTEYDDDESNSCLPVSVSKSNNLYSPILYFQENNEKNKKSNFLDHNITTINDKRFNVIGNTALNLLDKSDDENKYIDAQIFLDNFKIKHNSALVIDATAISILTILKKGKKVLLENGEWFTIYIIDDLETRNDPAGKSSWSSKYDKETGINIIFLEPDDPRVVSYIYNYDEENPLNKFFTDYTFKLQTDINGEGCTLIIADKIGKNVQINNPKEENAIEYVSSQIMEFLNIKSKDTFKTNVKYQQKRSGDWLQVLLCLLLLSRTYKNSINNSQKYNRSNISNIYFMTHDRIALAYALFSGVDTLFTHGQSGTIMLFDLQKDPESLLNSEYADCEMIMSPFRDADLEEIEKKRELYKNAYNEKKSVLKNQILKNEFINELKNMDNNSSINLETFKSKIKDLFTNIFIFYSFCTELTPSENFKPVMSNSLTNINDKIESLKKDSSSIENKLVEIKNFKMELTELVNNLKNIEQLCLTNNVNNWQTPTNNIFPILINKLDFTGGGALSIVTSRTISTSVIKNTEMFNFLQVFPFLDNEIQYMLNDLFYNFSFKVPTLVFQNYESSRTKEKPMMIIMCFCQEVMATFAHQPSIDMMRGGSFEKIFKDTSLYNLKYVILEQNDTIQEKMNSDICHTHTKIVSKKRIRDEDSDQMDIVEDEDYPLYKKEQYGGKNNAPFMYLNTERRKKILKYYLENTERKFYHLNKLVLYMVGISMIHQLENENIYESLDYDTYKLLYEILLMFEKENNDSIFLDNLFFGSSNSFEKKSLAIDLSYQLGKYFDLDINIFHDSVDDLNLLLKIQTLEHSYSSNNLFNLNDYNEFYKKVCSLVNKIGDEILYKIEVIEQKVEYDQGVAKGDEIEKEVAKDYPFAPPSPRGITYIDGGKRKNKKKTIKKSKNSKKTKKLKKNNKKTKKYRKNKKKSIKK